MFKRVQCCAVAVLALSASVAFGEAKDDLKTAVTKLADAASYSWTTTVAGGQANAGETAGKLEKGGFTWIKLPSRGGATFEVLMHDKAVVIKTDAGWKTVAEITAAAPAGGGAAGGGGGGGGGAGGARRSPEAMIAAQVANFATPSSHAKDMDTKLTNVKKTDDGFTADYTEAAAKELLQFRGGGGRGGAAATPPEVTNPKGTLAVTVKDGAATKIVVHVTGSMTMGGTARDIDRTTTTEIKDVGSTKIEVPEDAKKKLEEKPAM